MPKPIINISTDEEDDEQVPNKGSEIVPLKSDVTVKRELSIKVGKKRKASKDPIDVNSDESSEDTKASEPKSKLSVLKFECCSDSVAHQYPEALDIREFVIDTDEVENIIFDTHCHVDFILHRRLKGRLALRPQTYSQLVRQHPGLHHEKLEGFITNFCYPPTWPVRSPPYLLCSVWLHGDLSVHYTVGCHPHFAGLLLVKGEIERLERLLVEGRARGCVAVGECGLDRSRGNRVDLATQVIAFKMQVRLAMKLNLPLVLHIREAEEVGRRVLRECGLPRDWPVHRHCWNDSWRRCLDWLEEYPGSAVGLTGLVTFRNGVEAREVASKIPLERLLLETDAPYFTPDNLNSVLPPPSQYPKFCHPLQVLGVAVEVAKVRHVRVGEVLRQCRANIARVYRIPEARVRRQSVATVVDILEEVLRNVFKEGKNICSIGKEVAGDILEEVLKDVFREGEKIRSTEKDVGDILEEVLRNVFGEGRNIDSSEKDVINVVKVENVATENGKDVMNIDCVENMEFSTTIITDLRGRLVVKGRGGIGEMENMKTDILDVNGNMPTVQILAKQEDKTEELPVLILAKQEEVKTEELPVLMLACDVKQEEDKTDELPVLMLACDVKQEEDKTEELPVQILAKQDEDKTEELLKQEEDKTEELPVLMLACDVLCEVMVSACASPCAFWVQKIGPSSVDLDRLTQDMTEYYTTESNRKYHSLTTVSEGEVVACQFSGDCNYYRAKVVTFKENSYDLSKSTVDLDFLDFGDCEEKLIGEIFEIRTDFLKLKFQAIQCSMAHIRPAPDLEWGAESCDQFESLTHCAMWKVLWAKVVEYRPGSGGQFIPCVELIDTNITGRDRNIGLELVRQGLAIYQDKEDIKDIENQTRDN